MPNKRLPTLATLSTGTLGAEFFRQEPEVGLIPAEVRGRSGEWSAIVDNRAGYFWL